MEDVVEDDGELDELAAPESEVFELDRLLDVEMETDDELVTEDAVVVVAPTTEAAAA